jgi:hypothetical protein
MAVEGEFDTPEVESCRGGDALRVAKAVLAPRRTSQVSDSSLGVSAGVPVPPVKPLWPSAGFSCYEAVCGTAPSSAFRLFLRSLDPSACSGATESFESVYVCLLSRLDKRKWEGLLKLWRLCRNTCHNNGVYLPRKGDSEEVAFEGTTYRFEKGKLVRYGDWDTLIRVATRACDMLVDIVTAPQLSALPLVIDPSKVDHHRGQAHQDAPGHGP